MPDNQAPALSTSAYQRRLSRNAANATKPPSANPSVEGSGTAAAPVVNWTSSTKKSQPLATELGVVIVSDVIVPIPLKLKVLNPLTLELLWTARKLCVDVPLAFTV